MSGFTIGEIYHLDMLLNNLLLIVSTVDGPEIPVLARNNTMVRTYWSKESC